MPTLMDKRGFTVKESGSGNDPGPRYDPLPSRTASAPPPKSPVPWKPDANRWTPDQVARFQARRSREFNLASKANVGKGPYPQGLAPNYGMDPKTMVSLSDTYWQPNAKFQFWQQPQRIARYNQLIQNAPRDWVPPEWLDVEGVSALYNYLYDKNNGTPWYTWKAINYKDPAMDYIAKMQLPPAELMWHAEEIYGSEAVMERDRILKEGTPRIADWEKLENWQKWALGLFSPQPMQNRPTWTRLGPANAALQGMGGAAVGGMIGGLIGNVPGAAIGFTVGMSSALYTNVTGEKVPLLSDLLYMFNLPAEWTEQAIGVAKQASGEDWAFEELIDNFPEAWKASKLTYEAYGGPGQEMLNLWAQAAGDQPAEEGQAWMLQEGYSDPQNIQGPKRLHALTSARERIYHGEDAITVYMDMVTNFGYGGTLNDFIMQSVIDPMQLGNLAQSRIGKKIAGDLGFTRGAAAMDAASGRAYIDILPIGVQNATQGAMKLLGFDPYYYKSSSGILGGLNEWKRWIGEGGWPDGMNPVAAADLPRFEKWLGFLNDDGIPRNLLPSTNEGPGVMKAIRRWGELDPPSRVYAVADITNKNMGLLVRISNNTEEIKAAFGKAAGLEPVKAGDIGEALIKSPEMAAVQGAMKDFYENGKLDTLLAEFESAAPQRGLLEVLAMKTEKTTGEVLELIKDNPEAAARLFAETEGATEALRTYGIEGTAEELGESFKPFLRDDRTPWDIKELKAHVMMAADDHVDAWSVEKFNIKPDHWVFRMTNLMKGAQNLLMLNTVSYLTQNVTNNAVMLSFYEGIVGFMTPKQIDSFTQRAGVSSNRLTGERMGSVSMMIDPDMPSVQKARQTADFISKSSRLVRQVNKKLGLFANASRYMEDVQGRSATALGYLQMWNSLWRYGKQIPEMSGSLSTMLDQYAPGMKQMLISATEAGMNMSEIYNVVKQPMVRRSINDFITKSSEHFFPNHPEIGENLFNVTGLRNKLEGMLVDADTPAKQRAVFDLVSEEIQSDLDKMSGTELQARAKEVAAQIQTEGWKAVQPIFGEMKANELLRRVEHYALAHQVAEAAADVDYAEGSKLWDKFFETENRKFKRDQDHQTQTMAGIIKGLGMEGPEAKKYIQGMVKYYRSYRDFYGGYDVDSRSGRRLTPQEAIKIDLKYKRHVSGKNDILRDYHSKNYTSKNERTVARETAYAVIKELWNEQNGLAKATQLQMDEIFTDMWDKQKPGEGAKAREWRTGIADQTDRFYRELEMIWDQVTMEKDRSKVDKIWSDATRKIINPMLKEIIEQGEIQGFNRLINGKFEGIEVPAGPEGVAPEGLPKPLEAPTGKTAIDAQEIADQVGLHATGKKVLSDAEIQKRKAARDSYAILTRDQVRQQIMNTFPNATFDTVYAAMHLIDLNADSWAKKNSMDVGEDSRRQYYAENIAAIMRDGDIVDPLKGLNQLYQEEIANPRWYYSKLYDALQNLPEEISPLESSKLPDRFVPPRKPGSWQNDTHLPPNVMKKYIEGYTIPGKTIPGKSASYVLHDLLTEAGVKPEELRWSLPDSIFKNVFVIDEQKTTEYQRRPFSMELGEGGMITKKSLLDLFDKYQVTWEEKTLGYGSADVGKTVRGALAIGEPGRSGVGGLDRMVTIEFLRRMTNKTATAAEEYLTSSLYHKLMDENNHALALRTYDSNNIYQLIEQLINSEIKQGTMTMEDVQVEMWKANRLDEFIFSISDSADLWDEYADSFHAPYYDSFEAAEEYPSQAIYRYLRDVYTTENLTREAGMVFEEFIDMETSGLSRADLMAEYVPPAVTVPSKNVYTKGVGVENYREVLMTVRRGAEEFGGTGGHYGNKVQAWTRLGDEIIDGKKWLYIHEIQSDHAQGARDDGYISLENVKKLSELEARNSIISKRLAELKPMYELDRIDGNINTPTVKEYDALTSESVNNSIQKRKLGDQSGLREFPNMAHWEEMVLKKIVHTAAKEGYEGVHWTNAEEQFKMWGSDRYEWRIVKAGEDIRNDKSLKIHPDTLSDKGTKPIEVIKKGRADVTEYHYVKTYKHLDAFLKTDEFHGGYPRYGEMVSIYSIKRIIETNFTEAHKENAAKLRAGDMVKYRNNMFEVIGELANTGREGREVLRLEIIPFNEKGESIADVENLWVDVPITLGGKAAVDTIQITGRKQYSGGDVDQLIDRLAGETLEDFAVRTGQQEDWRANIEIDPNRSQEAIRLEIYESLKRLGLKKSRAAKESRSMMQSGETAGVFMPRYEGMRAAYDIRTKSHLEQMFKPWGEKAGDVVVGMSGDTIPETIIELNFTGGDAPMVNRIQAPAEGLEEGSVKGKGSFIWVSDGRGNAQTYKIEPGDAGALYRATQGTPMEENLPEPLYQAIKNGKVIGTKELGDVGPEAMGDWNYTITFDPVDIKGTQESRQGIRITDSMRESVVNKGLPLFQHQESGAKKTFASRMINDLEDVGFVSARTMAEIIGGEEPQYLYDVQEFMLGQRKKLLNGEFTERDIAKAWIETIASMRSKEITLDAFLRHMEKHLPGYELEIPDYFLQKKGPKRYIRPEEAVASWLLSPEGKVALDNVEAGRFTATDFDNMLVVRDAFGFNPVREWLFGENKQGQKTFADLAEITEQVKSRGYGADSDAMGDDFMKLAGIGRNKIGFIKHLLGMGDSPTIDSVELNMWITGEGDVRNLKGTNVDLLREMRKRPATMNTGKLSEYLGDNIRSRFNEMRELGLGSGIDPEVYEHVMHHWLWDKGKNTQTTHKGMYEAMRNAQTDGQIRKGSTEFLADGRAVIRAFKQADITTLVHELGHVFRRNLTGIELDTVAKFGGLEDGNELLKLQNQYDMGQISAENRTRYVQAEEKFAYGWELYMGEQKTYIPPGMQPVFSKFSTWIQDIYSNVAGKLGLEIPEGETGALWREPLAGRTGDIDMEIPIGTERKSMRQIFDGMMFDEETMKMRQVKEEVMARRPAGDTTTASGVTDSNRIYNFRFKVADLYDFTVSHDLNYNEISEFPGELQNKDRASFANRAQVDQNAKEFNNYKVLTDTHTLDQGLPIALKNAIMISGNGRIMMMKLMKDLYPAKWTSLQNDLAENVESYGLTARDLEGIEYPVVYRELIDDVDMVAFSKDANQRATMETTPAETAIDDSYTLGMEAIMNLEITPDQTVDKALMAQKNIPFINEFLAKIPQGESANLIDADGLPSELGVARIKNALFAATYKGDAGYRLLKLFSETADPGMKNLETAMYDTIGQAAMVEALIMEGNRDPSLSISKDLATAADRYRTLKRQDVDVNDYLKQYTTEERMPMKPFEAEMLLFINDNANAVGKLRDTLTSYYKAILNMPSEDQGALIGDARPGKGVILDGVTNKFREPGFAKAEAASVEGEQVSMTMAFEGTDVQLDDMLPMQHGEYLVNRRYQRNYHDIAYLTKDMDTNQFIDTQNGPAKLLGLDPDDPNSFVYEMGDGEIHSTREPADDGLYQTLYGKEQFVLPKNPNNTDDIVHMYSIEPEDDYDFAAWLLPNGEYINLPESGEGLPPVMHTDYVEPGYGMEEGSIAIRDGGYRKTMEAVTEYMPTPEQMQSIIKRVTENDYIYVEIGMDFWNTREEGQTIFSVIRPDETGTLAEKLAIFYNDLEEGNPRQLYQTGPSSSESRTAIQRAKEIFKPTDDPMNSGWMLTDGTMLDFQRRKPIGMWTEHSEIIRALPGNEQISKWIDEFGLIDSITPDQGDMAMADFMEMGNIRMYSYPAEYGNTVGFQIMTELTPDQLRLIIDVRKNHNLELVTFAPEEIYQLKSGGSQEELLGAVTEINDTLRRALYQDDPLADLFDDGKPDDSTVEQPTQGPQDNESQVWKIAAQHKDSQGKADLAGVDNDGQPIPESRMKLIRFIKKWGNPNDRRAVREFKHITPDIMERAMRREEAYLMAQMRLDGPATQNDAPLEGQYEDQMPANLYEGRAMDEIAGEYLKPMMDHMQNSYLQAGQNQEYVTGRMPKPVQEGVDNWLRQVETQMPVAKRISLGHGEGLRDQAMLNYSKRVGFDNLLNIFFPYQFWYTRSMAEWGRRMIDQPEWMAMYARMRKTQEKQEKEGMPSRLSERSRLPAAYLPDWMGGGIWYDPLKTLFPIDNFGQPLRNMQRLQSNLQYDAEEMLYKMKQESMISQGEYDEAKDTHQGPIWMKAQQAAEDNAAMSSGDPMSLVSTMMTPAVWWTAPYYSARGQPEKNTVMPATRQGQAFRHALQGTVLEPVGYLLGLAALPEETMRKMADISVFGEYGDWFVDRQLSNMAADGSAQPNQVLDAMNSRQGEIFEQAVKRVEQEMSVRYPGMLPLFAMKGDANMGEAITSLLGALSGAGQLLPEGELIQRGLQKEYSNAWEDLKAGDDEAINDFFTKYPEYQARLALFKEPQERMRSHLINLIWDGYGNLPRPNKKLVREQLGQEFMDKFYLRDTRDYDAIDIPTLTGWAIMLGKAVPETEENKSIREAGVTPLQVYPKLPAEFVEVYQDKRDEGFPNWYAEQTKYYSLPEGQARRDYLKKHKTLKDYWTWKHKYQDDHPEIQFWFDDQAAQYEDNSIDLSMMDPIMLRQLMIYAFGLESELGLGATVELETMYENSDSPAKTFDDYLEAVKLSVLK